jgi:hypothetical protein
MKENQKTITRKEACLILEIKPSKLAEIICHHKYLGFPAQMNTGLMNQLYYEHEVLEFKKNTDYHNIKWTQPPKRTEVKENPFDNALAVGFITKPRVSFSQIVMKHLSGKSKTIVIHLEEHDNFAPLRSGYTREYNGAADHRFVA